MATTNNGTMALEKEFNCKCRIRRDTSNWWQRDQKQATGTTSLQVNVARCVPVRAKRKINRPPQVRAKVKPEVAVEVEVSTGKAEGETNARSHLSLLLLPSGRKTPAWCYHGSAWPFEVSVTIQESYWKSAATCDGKCVAVLLVAPRGGGSGRRLLQRERERESDTRQQ